VQESRDLSISQRPSDGTRYYATTITKVFLIEMIHGQLVTTIGTLTYIYITQ